MTPRANSENRPLPTVVPNEDDCGTDLSPPTPINADRVGRGAPVVFLHGLLGVKEHFAPSAALLADRVECWLVQAPLLELRGAQCSVHAAAEMVSAFLNEHVPTPAVLVGNSLGGHLALRIALEQPERVRGIVLSGSSGLFERTFEKDVQHRPSHDWVQRKITGLFCDPSRVPDGLIDRAHEELSERKAARSLVRLSRTAKADHLGSLLPFITTPTLLLWGREDSVTPPSVAEEFRTLLPNAEIHWIEQCGHAPMIERPIEFAMGIRQFLIRQGVCPPDENTGETDSSAIRPSNSPDGANLPPSGGTGVSSSGGTGVSLVNRETH